MVPSSESSYVCPVSTYLEFMVDLMHNFHVPKFIKYPLYNLLQNFLNNFDKF